MSNQIVDLASCISHLKIVLEALLPPKDFVDPGMKVIHDPLWGSRLFYPWEIAIIDTPLCQRLRRIYQLGTAYLTYPSAVHTRFSHTLGVAVLAGRLITRLKEKAEILRLDTNISQKDIYTVRLAGILHDLGHCFFSHVSERVLKPMLTHAMKQEKLGRSNPHEFLSYLIVKHEYFRNFWQKNVLPLFKEEKHAPNLNDIAEMIVGRPPSDEKRYLQEIIAGPYDVDKLEYLYRDARMAGLEISYDIERYFYKIRLINKPTGQWRLAMDEGGVRAVEQIIFSKMMLFSFVYHHQKVLASDTLVTDLLLELLSEEGQGHIAIRHPLDFLKYTDYDILSTNLTGPTDRFDKLRNRILNRDLPKRCFVISKECINDLSSDSIVTDNWDILKKTIREFPDECRAIRQEIVDLIKKEPEAKKISREITIDDVFISFPRLPPIDEPGHAPVVNSIDEVSSMGHYFDLEGWQKTYDLKKIRYYFYASEDIRTIACEAVLKYLKKTHKLSFDESVWREAKICINRPLEPVCT